MSQPSEKSDHNFGKLMNTGTFINSNHENLHDNTSASHFIDDCITLTARLGATCALDQESSGAYNEF